jgi:hypothetical protein
MAILLACELIEDSAPAEPGIQRFAKSIERQLDTEWRAACNFDGRRRIGAMPGVLAGPQAVPSGDKATGWDKM